MTAYERIQIGRWPKYRGNPATWSTSTAQRFLHNAISRAVWGDGSTTRAEDAARLDAASIMAHAWDELSETDGLEVSKTA